MFQGMPRCSLGPRPAGLGDTDKLVDIESAAGKGLGDRVPAITACLSAARSDGDQADSALVRLIRKGTRLRNCSSLPATEKSQRTVDRGRGECVL